MGILWGLAEALEVTDYNHHLNFNKTFTHFPQSVTERLNKRFNKPNKKRAVQEIFVRFVRTRRPIGGADGNSLN